MELPLIQWLSSDPSLSGAWTHIVQSPKYYVYIYIYIYIYNIWLECFQVKFTFILKFDKKYVKKFDFAWRGHLPPPSKI